MPEPAPTLAAILLARYDLSVFCEGCGVTRVLDALDLALRRDENVPIDRFKFRCGKCHKVGKATVRGPGNGTMGFPIMAKGLVLLVE